MFIEYICSEAERIKKKYDECDPYKLCQEMKITVLFEPMGRNDSSCKGFFIVQSRMPLIIINSDLPSYIQRIIVTHELGHAVLHRKAAKVSAFHDFALFDNTSQMEYEANIFAAELLIEDRDILEILDDDISFFGAASSRLVPAELLDFKFRIMKKKGYKMIDPPLMANGDFLKNI
jgi:Zn-dependent peptidase ImmA (M78 family)